LVLLPQNIGRSSKWWYRRSWCPWRKQILMKYTRNSWNACGSKVITHVDGECLKHTRTFAWHCSLGCCNGTRRMDQPNTSATAVTALLKSYMMNNASSSHKTHEADAHAEHENIWNIIPPITINHGRHYTLLVYLW
jgi:hypothetical protein